VRFGNGTVLLTSPYHLILNLHGRWSQCVFVCFYGLISGELYCLFFATVDFGISENIYSKILLPRDLK
jgi:hypothetical protein